MRVFREYLTGIFFPVFIGCKLRPIFELTSKGYYLSPDCNRKHSLWKLQKSLENILWSIILQMFSFQFFIGSNFGILLRIKMIILFSALKKAINNNTPIGNDWSTQELFNLKSIYNAVVASGMAEKSDSKFRVITKGRSRTICFRMFPFLKRKYQHKNNVE